MNSCILMAQITSQPQLRYTQENQTPLADMMVEFLGMRETDPPSSLKVVAWRDLANEVSQNYQEGDNVILEGRLRMNILERQEGFKEKRAEFTLSRIYRIQNGTSPTSPAQSQVPSQTNSNSGNVVQFPASQPETTESTQEEEKNLDDIPF
ncbi:single-stranded DNA-binding protein [Dactylococcopsis salina]|uniref:Single-stranded DNA-binding protein n=1 Tax=Dactylococcopsis salina (strain PCC 8305) TaxID=13035 RepID=K9YT72_DACS8|nr:single-stranded DNA-binding protein [Dactylococcopsis salina]AFZ50099.1 single-stranded DNA-binding protein [Dactylococcopsis salina PCC 8305]